MITGVRIDRAVKKSGSVGASGRRLGGSVNGYAL